MPLRNACKMKNWILALAILIWGCAPATSSRLTAYGVALGDTQEQATRLTGQASAGTSRDFPRPTNHWLQVPFWGRGLDLKLAKIVTMLSVPDEKFWTYADYCKLPEDGNRYEVIDGVLHMSPAPVSIHQALSKYLQFQLYGLELAGHGWVFDAPMDVIMPGATPVQPDLIFITTEQRHILKRENIQGVPYLLVEILSPRGARYDRVTKLNKYAQCGVPHYWLLAPQARTLDIFRWKNGTYRLLAALEAGNHFVHSDFFDLKLDVAELFARIPCEIDLLSEP